MESTSVCAAAPSSLSFLAFCLTSAKSFWSVSLNDDFSSVLASADFSTFVAEAAFFFSSASLAAFFYTSRSFNFFSNSTFLAASRVALAFLSISVLISYSLSRSLCSASFANSLTISSIGSLNGSSVSFYIKIFCFLISSSSSNFFWAFQYGLRLW